MREPFERLLEIEKTPQFASLPVDQQFSYRYEFLTNTYANDPRFLSLTPQDQGEYLRKAVYREPVFETSQFKGWMDSSKRNIAGYKDPRSIGWGLKENLETMGPQVAGQVEAARSLGRAAMAESTVVMAASYFDKYAPQLAYKVAKGVLGENSTTTQWFKQKGEEASTYYRDREKWARYADYLIDENHEYDHMWMDATRKAASTVATGVDFMVASGTLRAGGRALFPSLNLVKGDTARGAISALKWVGGEVGDVSFGVARSYLKDYFAANDYEPQVEVTWENTALKLQGEVVGEMVGLAVGRTIAMGLKGAAKVMSKMGYLDSKVSRGPANIASAVDYTLGGKAVPPEIYANLPQGVKDNLQVIQNTYLVGTHLESPTPLQQLNAITNLNHYNIEEVAGGFHLKSLQDGVPDGPTLATFDRLQDYVAHNISGKINRTVGEQRAIASMSDELRIDLTPNWLPSMSMKKFGVTPIKTPEGYTLELPTGETKVFKDLRETSRFVLEGSTIGGKVDAALGPDLAMIDVNVARADYVQPGVFKGSAQDVMNHLNKFSSQSDLYKPKQTLLKNGDYRIYDTLELVNESTGYREMFPTASDAFAAMKEAFEGTAGSVKRHAQAKGWDLSWNPGGKGWVLYGEDSQLGFNTLKEVETALETVKVPKWAGEISGYESKSIASLGEKMGFTEPTYKRLGKKPLGFGMQFARATQPVDAVIAELQKYHALPPAAGESMRKVIVAHNVEQRLASTWDRIIEDSFTLTKKGLPVDARKYQLELEAVLNAKTTEEALANLRTLKDGEKFIEKHGEAFLALRDTVSTMRGKNEKLGLAAWEQIGVRAGEGGFEVAYTPRLRLRGFLQKNPAFALGDKSMVDVLEAAGVDSRWVPFFNQMRIAEVVKFAHENPLDAFKTVARMATRANVYTPAVKEFGQAINQAAKDGAINGDVMGLLANLHEILEGKRMKVDEYALKETTSKLLRKFGVDATTTRDLVDHFMGMSYSAALGWRPYPILRNLLEQPVMTLGTRFGNEYTSLAAKDIAGDNGTLFRRYLDAGVFPPSHTPRSGEGVKVIKSKLVGMGLYTHTEDYGRAVAYRTGERLFEEAEAIAKNGGFTKGGALQTKAFLNRSGVAKMDENIQRAVLDLVGKGDWGGAKHAFASQVVNETMFPYWRALNPKLLQGDSIIGRAYGQFGTYAYWYMDNLRRGFTRGNLGDRVGFTLRLAGNSTLLAGGAAALGVNWKDFVPWGPLGFSGGPYLGVLEALVNVGNQGYKGRQARAELFGLSEKEGKPSWDLSTFMKSQGGTWMFPIPGRLQARALKKMVEAYNQGDVYQAFLLAMGAPLNPRYKD